jgi:hypothetical protein
MKRLLYSCKDYKKKIKNFSDFFARLPKAFGIKLCDEFKTNLKRTDQFDTDRIESRNTVKKQGKNLYLAIDAPTIDRLYNRAALPDRNGNRGRPAE